MNIPAEYQKILLVAVEEYMYQLSLKLAKMKGQPLTQERKELTRQQRKLEELQHLVLDGGAKD